MIKKSKYKKYHILGHLDPVLPHFIPGLCLWDSTKEKLKLEASAINAMSQGVTNSFLRIRGSLRYKTLAESI